MEIETLRFGRLDLDEEKVITFPRGILGFSANRRYVLFPHSEGSPFCWLQSVDDGAVAFVVMDPRVVEPSYRVDVDEQALSELDVSRTDELDVVCIVTIPQGDPTRTSINLLGPIIINARNRRAVQVVCEGQEYSHQRPLMGGGDAAP